MTDIFTGIKDTDRLILDSLNDKDLLSTCSVNKYLYSLCDDRFFRNRLFRTYPDSIKYKPDDMSWKKYYLNVIYWVNKILEDQEFVYKTGDPKKYFDLFYDESYAVYQLKHAAEYGYTDFLDHVNNKYGLHGYVWVIVQGAAKSNNRKLMEKYNYLKHLDYALLGAVEGEQLELVKELIEKGAAKIPKVVIDNLNTALAAAARTGNKEIMEILINNGADDFNQALAAAARTGNKELIDYFLTKYPDVDKRLGLMGAAYGGNMDIFNYLLEKSQGIQVSKDFFYQLEINARDAKREKMPGNHDEIIEKIEELYDKLFG